MKKIKNTKGFTLMEMLIVVAIIAILIAIAIPTFNSSLNKAKVATDEANIRSGYAAVMTAILTEDEPAGTYILNVDGTVTKGDTSSTAYQTKGTPADAVSIGGINVNKWSEKNTVKYTVAKGSTGTGDAAKDTDGYVVQIAVN